MINPWDLEETRILVERVFGRDQLQLLKPCLRSINNRQLYARYHYHEAKDALEEIVQKHLDEASLVEVIFSPNEEVTNAFYRFRIKAEAHSNACLQNMHALYDTLAYAVHHALALNLQPGATPPSQISIRSVCKALSDSGEFRAISDTLNKFVDHDGYKHVSAIVNHGKHRHLIEINLSEDWTGREDEKHGLVVEDFEFGGVRFPKVRLREVLTTEYDRCVGLVSELGHALNDVLRTRNARETAEK